MQPVHHLISFRVDNFKGIEAFEVALNGKSAIVEGANGTGKTSLLDAVYFLFTGKGVDQAVRAGADEAAIEGVVGDMLVRRKVKDSGRPALVIKGADGKPLASPSDVLERLVGSGAAMRPLTIFGMKDSEQRDQILSALDVSVVEETAREKAAYDERTGVNRTLKDVSSRVDALIQQGAGTAPQEPIDAKAAMERISGAESRVRWETTRADAVAKAQAKVREAEEALAKASQALQTAEAALAEVSAAAADTTAADELKAAREAFAGIGDHNAKHKSWLDLKRERETLKKTEERVKQLTATVEEARAARGAKLEAAAAAIGVEGLKFTDDGVLLNGVRLSELCHAEQLVLGMRIFIPAMKRLGVRLLLIDEAGSLDDDTLREVNELARAHQIQVIFARPKTGAELEVEIINGAAA